MSKQIQTVFITGATSGIGKACAERFAATGARLLLCARREDLLTKTADQLRQNFKVEVFSFVLDVSQRQAVEAKIAELPTAWQAIDILINNAGLALGLEPVHSGHIDDWEAMIDTNVKGLLYVTRAVLPQMVVRNQGHVINIGSIAGREVYAKGVVYCATKHAVSAISQGMRMDLLGTNIRVSLINPGMVETNFSAVRFKGDQERAATVYEGLKPLSAEDIADAVLYCVQAPHHVNVSEMFLMPTAQAAATMAHRSVSK